jgi:zinc transport system substrate-binding protein
MSPVRVKQQAATMTDVLIELAPAQKEQFRKNFDAFARDLDRLHEQLKNTLAPLAGQNFFVFHPAFGYLADDYGLNQIPVETMGRSPKGKELSAIIKLAKEEKARVIFVQPQFDRQAAGKSRKRSTAPWCPSILWPRITWTTWSAWPIPLPRPWPTET